MTLLFDYLLRPFHVIRSQQDAPAMSQGLAAILLFSLSIASGLGMLRPGLVVALVIIGTMLLIFAAVIIDFFAQCLGAKAASVQAFKWLALSMGLWVLFKPVQLLQGLLSPGMFSLAYIGFYSFLFSVQVQTLKQVYKVGTGKAFLLWAVPGLFVGCGLGAAVLGMFQVF